MLTLDEIMERMVQRLEPEEVIELLDISVEDLLDHFDFRLAERYEQLNEEMSDEY
jgi:hypothetical protein